MKYSIQTFSQDLIIYNIVALADTDKHLPVSRKFIQYPNKRPEN